MPKITREVRAIIDSDGDVYFQVEDMKLRVSSKVLATASEVFTAMFNANFQEGRTLASGESCHIPLPDVSIAKHILCLVLHDKVLTSSLAKVNSHTLLKVVILANRYAFVPNQYITRQA